MGLSTLQNGGENTVSAARSLALASAILLPEVLQVSGVGPAAPLRQHGIPLMVNLSDVGLHLQGDPQMRLIDMCTKPITSNDALRSVFGKVWMGLRWALFRPSLLVIGIGFAGMFTKAFIGKKAADVASQAPGNELYLVLRSRNFAG